MVSACVNKISDFPSPPPPSSWLSPRISSLSRDLLDQEPTTNIEQPQRAKPPSNHSGFGFGFVNRDLGKEMGDFEFPLEEEDPVKMLPADELFSDGKLVPLHIHRTVSESVSSKSNTNVRPPTETMESITTTTVKSSLSNQLLHHQDSTSSSSTAAADLYLFSPKAPRCSSRWRELLGLKRQQQNKQDQQKKNPNSSSTTSRSLKYFLHRNSNIKSDSLPLLQDIDSSSAAESIISRLSLSSSSSSSSSSGEDVPRISLDSDNNNNKISNLNNNRNHRNLLSMKDLLSMKVKLDNKKSTIMTSRPWSTSGRSCCHLTTVRVGRTSVRSASSIPSSRGVSVDSPRMNSSGKIVFQSLERSSSSPSSFNGGPPASNRLKSRGIGMERSYSANLVRVSPVLNVPVCSLKSGSVFGFGQLFSCPQKRDGGSSTSTRTHAKKNHHHHKTATGIGGGGNGG